MADALISVVLEQLASILRSKLSKELELLEGVEKEIQKLITDFETITAVLDDAEKRSVKENAVEKWVYRLKDICYDMEDVLDEWRTETVRQQQHQPPESASSLKNKVRSWTSSHLPWFNRTVWKRNIAFKIKDINQRLDEVVKDKDRYNFKFITGTTPQELERPETTSLVDVSEIYGRDDVKEILINGLVSESSQEKHNLTITAIVGMGGIGKTTLAQLAFNDENVKKHFKERRIWVCVSNPFNVTSIARAILEGLDIKHGHLTQQEKMLQVISLESRRFLLVLDDVWNEDNKKWEPLRNCLKNGAQGSKILVTTRKKRVADIMEATNPIRLEKLLMKECWSIFRQHAFFGRSKEECRALEEIGKKISERCKGLPLAAKVLGGLMRFKRSRMEWQNVLDSDLWDLEEAKNDIYPVFMLSYYDLPSALKGCFTYCAIFPEDHDFDRDDLIQQWMANGFLKGREMEITGEDYFESLAMRSLFQDMERDPNSGRIVKCKMHDLVREFAVRLSRNECGAIEVYKDEKDLMMELQPGYAKLRQVRLICKGGHSSTALSKFRIKGLRTLVSTGLEGPNAEMKVLRNLFCGLISLRALDLRRSDIKELPVEIGNLMRLRYLGLEWNRHLEALPETVCDLINLQSLKLSYSSIKRLPKGIGKLLDLRLLELIQTDIKKLPKGIGKLLKLRHLSLIYTNIEKLPKGIGELTSLQALSGLKIRCSPPKHKNGDGSSNNNKREEEEEEEEEYFGIGDLEKLNDLHGDLHLYSLGDLKLDDAVGEAKRAGLKNKKNLRELHLGFDGSSSRDEAEKRTDLLIAEALLEEPPPYLERLGFEGYRGTELPSRITSLSGLKSLDLRNCPNLKEVPGDSSVGRFRVSIAGCRTLEAEFFKRKGRTEGALKRASVPNFS